MSTRRPGKKIGLPAAPKATTPRTAEELQKSYGALLGQFGGVTFQIEMLNAQLTEIKKQLVDNVNEFNARRELDAKVAAAAQSTAQAPTEQQTTTETAGAQ